MVQNGEVGLKVEENGVVWRPIVNSGVLAHGDGEAVHVFGHSHADAR